MKVPPLTAKPFSIASALAALCLLLPAHADAADTAFEPNDSVAAAYGPLSAGQAYPALLAAPTDSDFFYFYVATERPADVTIVVRNSAVAGPASALNATIVDGLGNPIDAFGYAFRGGESATAADRLAAGKYFLRISPVEGSEGDIPYLVEASGEHGAFAAYEEIASRCAKADQEVAGARQSLRRAEGRLARAKGRRLRARYSGARARHSAAAVYRNARSLVRSKRAAVQAARAGRIPWCSIGR